MSYLLDTCNSYLTSFKYNIREPEKSSPNATRQHLTFYPTTGTMLGRHKVKGDYERDGNDCRYSRCRLDRSSTQQAVEKHLYLCRQENQRQTYRSLHCSSTQNRSHDSREHQEQTFRAGRKIKAAFNRRQLNNLEVNHILPKVFQAAGKMLVSRHFFTKYATQQQGKQPLCNVWLIDTGWQVRCML